MRSTEATEMIGLRVVTGSTQAEREIPGLEGNRNELC
jgi:hypothetical protein